MATPASELASLHAELSPAELGHLQRLLGSWGVLADLSFSDLLLLVPCRPGAAAVGSRRRGALHSPGEPSLRVQIGSSGHGEPVAPYGDRGQHMIVLGQMRPNNRPTLLEDDLVGTTVPESEWIVPVQTLLLGDIRRGTVNLSVTTQLVDLESIPVRFRQRVVAVLVRLSPTASLPASLYERTYLRVFERLAAMVAESEFPFPGEDVGTEETPRVGDGFVLVDAQGRVEFASPNAINAFHRMGVFADPEGETFTALGVEESAIEWALATGRPVVEEVERRPDVIVLVHCIPLLARGMVTGAVILLRDVTDVRRLDRLLLSKDAAIREVHHRVKNNLQTISSLLSLQARRAKRGGGREELREAERRVRSIAVVHEILSREPADQVPFDEIVEALVRMAEDSVVGLPIEITVSGDLGAVPAEVATPLSVTLAELLQNAVEHAFEPEPTSSGELEGRPGAAPGQPDGRAAGEATKGHVRIVLEVAGGDLCVEVIDDGRGLPEGFDLEQRTSLGLSIVRDLVQSQLGGSISMERLPVASGGGTRARIRVPRETVDLKG